MSKNLVHGKVDPKLRNPLAVARGLGSAKGGTEHWWEQRMSSLALIPLGLWFVFSLSCMAGAEYGAVRAWMAAPVTATLLVLFIAIAFHHVASGMQVVFEDYVQNEAARLISIITVKFLAVVLAVLCIVSVLKIALGG